MLLNKDTVILDQVSVTLVLTLSYFIFEMSQIPGKVNTRPEIQKEELLTPDAGE